MASDLMRPTSVSSTSLPRLGRNQAFPQLEVQDAKEQRQTHGVRDDDNNIALQKAINRPKGHAGCQREEHLEREIPSRTGLPTLLQLWVVRHGGAERRNES